MVSREQVVAKAASYVGLADQGYKDNEFSREWGIAGLDYCAAFVSSIFWRLGAALPDCGVKDGFLYVPYAVNYARNNGQSVEVPAQALPGDVVLFCWDGIKFGGPSAVGDHTGIVESHDGGVYVATIEGNTTPQGGGDRGIWRRWRHIDTIACYWRPAVLTDDGGFGVASFDPPVTKVEVPDVLQDERDALMKTAMISQQLSDTLNVGATGWRFEDGRAITTLPEFLDYLFRLDAKRSDTIQALAQKLEDQMTSVVGVLTTQGQALANLLDELAKIGPASGGGVSVGDVVTELGRRLTESITPATPEPQLGIQGFTLGTGAINPPKPFLGDQPA